MIYRSVGMFANQRLNIIQQLLLEKKQIDIVTLTSILNVSDVTVRKDLSILESKGFLHKVHGGAVLAEDVSADQPIVSAEDEVLSGIASLALTLIEDGDSLFLGQGGGCTVLAKKMSLRSGLTILTNNASALPFLNVGQNNVLFIGGNVASDNGSLYTYGAKAMSCINGLLINKAFICSGCVDIESGLTTNQNLSLGIYEYIIHTARNITLLATHTEFNKTAMQRLCPLSSLTSVVTDNNITDQYRDYFFRQNIKLLTFMDI